jgi:hypothetical protein
LITGWLDIGISGSGLAVTILSKVYRNVFEPSFSNGLPDISPADGGAGCTIGWLA